MRSEDGIAIVQRNVASRCKRNDSQARRELSPEIDGTDEPGCELTLHSHISCDALSAIITTGACVLPETIVGMIEASTTRKASMP